MKSGKIGLFLLGMITLLLVSGCCKPGIIGSLPVQLRSQETSMWCWAASGEMVMDYLVRLDELKEYGPGKSVSQMLHATGRLIFPLEVNQRTMSMVVLYQEQEKWMIESYGGEKQIRMATDLRKQIAEAERKSSDEVFRGRIPALQLMFIGFKEGMDIYLSPLFDMEAYGFKKGRKYQDEEVMEKPVEAARQHNGLPT